MKKIIITQRQDCLGNFREVRDNIDIRLINLIEKIGFLPISIPNSIQKFDLFLRSLNPDGIILSGGGDINKKDDRYNVEIKLIKYSINKNIPLLGICRGAQQINSFFGGKQKRIKNHVRKNHIINFKNNIFFKQIKRNSFHDYGFNESLISRDLTILGTSNDNIVEYFIHKKNKISGIMWHPERYKVLKEFDKKIFEKIFK